MARDFAVSAADSVASAVVRDSAVVRFAGDSGDGMQLSGNQFTLSTALAGNALATFPDFPAEIRAPQGSTFGVSAFQINFGSTSIETAGDEPDMLIAMNPAALKVNLADLRPGGLIIVDEGAFGERNLRKAGYTANPLQDSTLARFEVVALDITRLTLDAVKPHGLGSTDALRCKNMWALGLALWMFDRDREPVAAWIKSKFGAKSEALANANIAALNAGHAYGETAEVGLPLNQIRIAPGGNGARPLPDDHRQRSDSARSRRRQRTLFAAHVPRLLSHHAGERHSAPFVASQGTRRHNLPGRGRNRRDLFRDWRFLRRQARRYIHIRARDGAQDRGDRACHHVGVAACRRELPARRPLHRIADQNGAIRPLPGGLRPQRRRFPGRHRGAQPGRLLRVRRSRRCVWPCSS